MVEGTTLEMWRRRNPTGSSNLPLSANGLVFKFEAKKYPRFLQGYLLFKFNLRKINIVLFVRSTKIQN